jgi:3-hydroxyisobutyrate dehydrogenase-like beta-hydroxyacid dehydrogenase
MKDEKETFKMNISVLGMGIIGSAWAKNLIADGHTVRCWNRTPKNFPNFTPSIQEAVSGAEVIFIIVYDPPAVQSVLNQIQSKLGPGKLVIQSSTISAKWTRLFAEQVQKTGAWFLEAPFTGSKIAAEQRQTIYYLGGDPTIVEKARPILKPLSSVILHIGPLGSASTMKLAMNLNIAGIAQTLCESLMLCRKAGIPDDIYFSALMPNVARSGVSNLKGPKLRQHDYSAQFSVKNMAKDLRLALETAAELSLSLEQTGHLKNIYDQGIAAGWSNDDFIGLMRLLEKKHEQ